MSTKKKAEHCDAQYPSGSFSDNVPVGSKVTYTLRVTLRSSDMHDADEALEELRSWCEHVDILTATIEG